MSWLCVVHSLLFLVFIFGTSLGFDFKAFDDTILFKINWPGKTGADLLDSQLNAEPYTITTANKEKYQCFIPQSVGEEPESMQEYTGPSPIEFLMLLFNQNSCSYRLESYWTYELCHGRFVQQYHEERDGKKVKIQKYELGKFDSMQMKKLVAQYDEQAKNPNMKKEIPVKKIDGINMPYVELEMTDGTMCDLNNKPRSIRVLYVCYQHGKQEIYSIKETASCEYETIVLTPLLCGHPDYKPQDTEENKINCRPIDNALKKPRSLMALEAESLKLRHQKALDEKPQKVVAILRVNQDGQDKKSEKVLAILGKNEDVQDGEPKLRFDFYRVDSAGKQYNLDDTLNSLSDKSSSTLKSNSVENFLSGKNCLHGGTGWWKYEFCYGRSVTQYHIEIGGSKTVMNLGVFDKERHMEWIKANPDKAPKPAEQRKQLSHLYSYGSVCDKTGKPRQTEVKLKCVTNSMGSQSSVALYLSEPKTCEYLLVVESPLICDILHHADDVYGIISDKVLVNFEDVKSNLKVGNNDERIANEDE